MTTDPVNWASARRRLEAVFGDLLPSVTSDEQGLDEPDRNAAPDRGPDGRDSDGHDAARHEVDGHQTTARESAHDAELLANRPPHHDRD